MIAKLWLHWKIILPIMLSIFLLFIIGALFFFYTEDKLYEMENLKNPGGYTYVPNVVRAYRTPFEVDNFIFKYPDDLPWVAWYYEKSFKLNNMTYKMALISHPHDYHAPYKTTDPPVLIYVKLPPDINLERIDTRDVDVLINGKYYKSYTVEKIAQYHGLLIKIAIEEQKTEISPYTMSLTIPLELYKSSYGSEQMIEFIFYNSGANCFYLDQLRPVYQSDPLVRFVFWFYNISIEKAFKVFDDPTIDIVKLAES
jgi:hypothetical protein